VKLVSLLLAAVCVLAASCGGDSGEPGGGTVVRMEADSFSPATLTVKAGESVTFENESGDDKWPASDVHPTHEEYPGFDAERAVLDGESYEFTFERRGRWGYHDHLNPDIVGTIVVE
jgi:plastocyanin